jgi:hypothetical protein
MKCDGCGSSTAKRMEIYFHQSFSDHTPSIVFTLHCWHLCTVRITHMLQTSVQRTVLDEFNDTNPKIPPSWALVWIESPASPKVSNSFVIKQLYKHETFLYSPPLETKSGPRPKGVYRAKPSYLPRKISSSSTVVGLAVRAAIPWQRVSNVK